MAARGRQSSTSWRRKSALLSTSREFESRRVRQIIAIFADFIGLFGRLMRPQYGPQSGHRLGGSGLAASEKDPFQHCIMQRLADLWAACERAIDDDPAALSTSTRRERPSPATAHYEMSANLQEALPARTAVSKSSRSWSRCSWLNDSMSILCALSTSSGPPPGPAVFELHRVVVPSCSGAAAVPRAQAPRHRPPRVHRAATGSGRPPAEWVVIRGNSINRLCLNYRKFRKLISVSNFRYCRNFRHGHFVIGSVGATAPKIVPRPLKPDAISISTSPQR